MKRDELMNELFGSESEKDETESVHEFSRYLDEGNGGQEHGRGKDDEYENERKDNNAQLQLEIPLRPPPALRHQMHMMKASNILGFEPKPFDPETYVEQDEAAGSSRNNNIIRWREVENPDGTTSIESNARFVQWSDGSVQLMIGNETLDTHVQDTEIDQAHLFLRHDQGILQSQGRLKKKMSVTPSSLSSTSHQQLVSRVNSRNRKVHKVKSFFTNVDPDKEKEQHQKAESQAIRTNALLNRRKAKVSRKYMLTSHREWELSSGLLEDSSNEEQDPNYYESHRLTQLRFKEDPEIETQRRKRRLIIAKKDIPKKSYVSVAKSSKCDEEEEEGGWEYEDEVEDNENVEDEESDDAA